MYHSRIHSLTLVDETTRGRDWMERFDYTPTESILRILQRSCLFTNPIMVPAILPICIMSC